MLKSRQNETAAFYTKMSSGEPNAFEVTKKLMDEGCYIDLEFCDQYEIRGARLCRLYNECCNNNTSKFKRTILLFKIGVYSKEDIISNLDLSTPIPFIDDNIKIFGAPSYDEQPDYTDPAFDAFCQENQTNFLNKLKDELKKKTK